MRAQAIDALASVFAQHDLASGDRVLIVAENRVATAASIFAAGVSGAVAVPVIARMTGAEIRRVREHAEPRITVFMSAGSEAARGHARTAGAAEIDTPVGRMADRGVRPIGTASSG